MPAGITISSVHDYNQSVILEDNSLENETSPSILSPSATAQLQGVSQEEKFIPTFSAASP